jgi:hypothetical protein
MEFLTEKYNRFKELKSENKINKLDFTKEDLTKLY